jgi:putative ABC transport system substrate-binding protein
MAAGLNQPEGRMTYKKIVGVLYGGYPQPWHEPFNQKLTGAYEVDSRYARGQWGENLQHMANDLVGNEVDVLVTMDTPSMNAVLNVTSTIPTVSLACRVGISSDLLHPEGNLTGLVNREIDTVRQLRMLTELLRLNGRDYSPVGVLYNQDNPAMANDIVDIEEAARDMQVGIRRLGVGGPNYDFEAAFAAFGDAKGLMVLEEPVTVQHRKEVAHFVLTHNIPGMYETRTYLDEGGLLSYGPDRASMFLRMADFVRTILDNDLRAGSLPPMEEVDPALLLNRQVATQLGITSIPATLDGVRWAD